MKLEPDLPCNIGDGKDPIDKEFEVWFKAIPNNLKRNIYTSLERQLMKEAWNAAWHEYSPKISEDCLLTHIGRLILYHRDMKVDKKESKKFIEVLNKTLGIEEL